MSSDPADLLSQARIRLAALELFGRQGFDKTTIRQIAAAAAVSPGLVIHHFGSKDALREACDDYVMQLVLAEKTFFVAAGDLANLAGYLDEHPEMQPVLDYLVRALREGGPIAEHVFNRLCDLTEQMMGLAAEAGLVRVPPDAEAANALMAAWSAGLLVLNEYFARRLGGASISDRAVLARYSAASVDLLTHGAFTPAYGERLLAALEEPDKEK